MHPGFVNDGEDSQGRRNRFERSRQCCSPPGVSPSRSPNGGKPLKKRRRVESPGSRYYDSEDSDENEDEEARGLRKLKESRNLRGWNFYTYCAIEPDEIRLLLLSPGKHGDKIYCSLKTLELERILRKKLRYQALSYCWGDEQPTDVVFLQDMSVSQPAMPTRRDSWSLDTQTSPRPLAVRPNLIAALHRLRSETEDVWLWVDAICINQKDNNEKNNQLPKMPDIYRSSWNVTIWIGDCYPHDDLYCVLDFLPSILNLKLLDRLVEGDDHDEGTLRAWVRFASVLKRPWFSRRWVVQEVAFGNRVSVRCGNKVVSWLDFADAVELFMRKLEQIRRLYDASELSRYDPDALNNIESAGAQTMVSTTNSMLRKTDEGSILDYDWDLESLVMRLTSFGASDPRDTIFAFCALAKDGNQKSEGIESAQSSAGLQFVAQYTKPARDVYMEFVEYCVKTTGSLDIICRHWALSVPDRPLAPSRLPSWIGVVENSSFGPPSSFTGRINGDSLVGQPGARIYNASQQRPPDVSFGLEEQVIPGEQVILGEQVIPGGKRKRVDMTSGNPQLQANIRPPAPNYSQIPRSLNGELHAKGVILQEISCVSSRVVDGTISEDCLRTIGWDGDVKTFESIPDHIWRMLVANRGPDGKNPPMWYKRACVYTLKKTSAEGDLNTSKLIAHRSLPESVLEYLKRVQAVVWSKKFFSCEKTPSKPQVKCCNEHLYGIGSRNIQKGDLVCILFGCSVPVILRRSESTEDGRIQHVSFLGESYVHGKMEGGVKENFERVTQGPIEFCIS
ncbi:heterokaryon incompatibility protein-domain-containing protein [Cadophora sp. MPI-SDFR-AT-0126]|nr:heterokaryon incompatibility protein-domain-containing protein [Leotiomycetes sp. MPI-SDFR-AT-0126]